MNAIYRDFGLAFRLAVLMVSVVMGVIVLVACARIANAATLRSEAVLNGAVLTAGNLFAGLNEKQATYALGPAPQPGQKMVLNAVTLMRVAATLNIDWKPQSTADQIVVSSASIAVDSQTIHDAITAKLQEKGVSGKFNLSFYSEPSLVLAQDLPSTAEVASIAYHADSDRFEATVVAPSAAKPQARVEVTGHVERLVEVPVLKKAVRNGDPIDATMVEWTELPARNVQPDFVIEAEHLIGKTPRRMVMAGKPIRTNDLAERKMVSRGESVTIIYEKGPITVTAKGKALEDGAQGAAVRVVNVASNRSIDATVSDQGLVTVTE